MPVYAMDCTKCGRVDIVHPMDESHPHWHAACGGELTRVFGSFAIHGVGAAGARRTWERERETDQESYRRLRADGTQPPQVTGSRELELRADEKVEVQQNTIFEGKIMRHRVQAAADVAAKEGTSALLS